LAGESRERPSEDNKMKKIAKYVLSKYDPFWTPVGIAGLGIAFYISRFFDFIEDHVHHQSAIAIALLVVAFTLVLLGTHVDWFHADYGTRDELEEDR
jgi:NhaP-type Na+/H+ or K+/H+ antiporter